MGAFADLVLYARQQPVPVVDLLRAWRQEGRGEPDDAALAAMAGPETTSVPTDAWLECLRALEHAFAPNELEHLTAAWSEDRQVPQIASTEPQLRARVRRAAEEGGFDATGEGAG